MKSFAEKNIRYLLEFIVIISGVFLSFYLDDIRELGQKKQYKDNCKDIKDNILINY